MQQTVKLCKEHGIAIGAHPGFPDVQGFGRREMKLSPEELTAMVRYQVGALKGFLDAEDVPLHHVKPHGVLYGLMYRDKETCQAVYAGVPKGIPVFGLAGTFHEEVAKEMGLPFVAELYGDVKYNADKTLVIDRKKQYVCRVPHTLAVTMLTQTCRAWDPEVVKKHIRMQVENSRVTAVNGEEIELPVNGEDVTDVSLCCHSDTPGECMAFL